MIIGPICGVYACVLEADYKLGNSYLCKTHAMNLGFLDKNGIMLDPRLVNLHNDDSSREIRNALANLVELHDEQPSQLTAEDWERARKALKKAS